MSLEQSIANFTTQAGLLLDLPAQISAAANAKIAEFGTVYNTRIANMSVEFWVDAATGNDNAAGTSAAPLATIIAAVNRTPPGATVNIRLKSNVVVANAIYCHDKKVVISPADGARKTLQFTKGFYTIGATSYRRLEAFELGTGGSVTLINIQLIVPEVAGVEGGYIDNFQATCFRAYGGRVGIYSVVFELCEIVFPAEPFGAVGGTGAPVLLVNSSTVTGSANGKWLHAVTASGGTNPTTLPNVVTNLPIV